MCKQVVYRRSLVPGQSAPFPVVWTFRCTPRADERRAQSISVLASASDAAASSDGSAGLRVDSVVHIHATEVILFEVMFFVGSRPQRDLISDEIAKALLDGLLKELPKSIRQRPGCNALIESIETYLSRIPRMLDIVCYCSMDTDFTIKLITPSNLNSDLEVDAECNSVPQEEDLVIHTDDPQLEEMLRAKVMNEVYPTVHAMRL
ncbi:MAG TPA: hypothetical protein VGN12_30585 [Pirellulales bacterium]|jgi:hypothetical protein